MSCRRVYQWFSFLSRMDFQTTDLTIKAPRLFVSKSFGSLWPQHSPVSIIFVTCIQPRIFNKHMEPIPICPNTPILFRFTVWLASQLIHLQRFRGCRVDPPSPQTTLMYCVRTLRTPPYPLHSPAESPAGAVGSANEAFGEVVWARLLASEARAASRAPLGPLRAPLPRPLFLGATGTPSPPPLERGGVLPPSPPWKPANGLFSSHPSFPPCRSSLSEPLAPLVFARTYSLF